MDGLATAFDEITLVFFTTLAPSGALAYVLMALPIIVRPGSVEEAMYEKLDRFLCLPVLVAMVGLIASATHLGNPANVLYVLTGFGRSPLSTEVVVGAVFLGSAGVFWLTAFSEKAAHVTVRRIVAAVISLLGLGFIGAVSLAYDVDTIISWDTLYTPVTTWLNALCGGPILALLGLRLARFYTPEHKLGRAFVAVAAAALAISVAVYAFWAASLPQLQSALASASEYAPLFGPSIALFVLLGAASLVLAVKAVRWPGEAPTGLLVAATVLMLAAIFLMRFQFYMIHLTAGL